MTPATSCEGCRLALPSRKAAVALALAGAIAAQTGLAASERTFKETVFEAEKQEKLKLGGSKERVYEYQIQLSDDLAPECAADVSISYVPMYDKVRVDTIVEHDGCPASSGDYRIELRTRGADGQIARSDIHESWQRATAAPVENTRTYALDVDRELVDVRVRTSRKTNCRCDALGEDDAALTSQ